MVQAIRPDARMPQMGFVMSGAISHSGKVIGRSVQRVLVTPATVNRGGQIRPGPTTAHYKRLREDNATAALEQLVEESAENYRRTAAYAIRRAYHGGLPELGKDR